MAYLAGENMTGGYGDADILHNCTISVEKGEIAVVVGPNGAGKSTAMKAVFGMLPLRQGQVLLDGEDITTLKTARTCLKRDGVCAANTECISRLNRSGKSGDGRFYPQG